MATPEELEKARLEEEAKKAADEVAKKAAEEEARKKELESIPEALRGKSQKELADMALEASLQAEREKKERERLAGEVERLRPRGEAEPTEAEKKAAREKKLISDPVAYIDEMFEQRTKPLSQEYYGSQVEVQLRLAKTDKLRYPDFEKVEKPVREILDRMPLEARGNPLAIDVAYKLARYPEMEKALAEKNAAAGLHNELGGAPAKVKEETRALDDEEKKVAAKFGMSEKEYLEWSEKRELD